MAGGDFEIMRVSDGFVVWSNKLQETLTEFDTEEEARQYINNGWARELEDELSSNG